MLTVFDGDRSDAILLIFIYLSSRCFSFDTFLVTVLFPLRSLFFSLVHREGVV